MTRQRAFCRYCGAMTKHLDRCCEAHRELLSAEQEHLNPGDPATTLPTMLEEAARQGEDAQATRERGA